MGKNEIINYFRFTCNSLNISLIADYFRINVKIYTGVKIIWYIPNDEANKAKKYLAILIFINKNLNLRKLILSLRSKPPYFK